MSLGDDTGRTRTRLPEASGDPYGGARRNGRSSSRSLVTVVGVVVLLIAAIAFANRGGGDSDAEEGGDSPKAAATAPTGEKPVPAGAAGIPAGFAHDRQGAESAAANYAVALGSAEMFTKARRDAILQSIIVPARIADFEARLDKAYTPEFNKNVGLNGDGTAPEGLTFVSRTTPIGTKVTESSSDTATVEVWCSGLLGLAGESSTSPVTNSWFTITMLLEWTDDDWKIVTHSQKDGPTPVPGDERASNADEMAKAVQEYGGFTYAR
ncbi:hypothetical protein ACFWJE_26690 [Streptomyces griseoincarnatus]|uniref:DUF8175 domain-containing protein n=1 Tax=Streptomyces griseoincarnatus TaxID=29305 RepID=A0ABT0VVQ9_STRGI|nr:MULTISPECIES: hypothetical protein [Streptomyces]MBJ6633313.1 hypothetical protein [Streptomyces sp. I5]MBQ0974275.1 hypothetical protein [Streptomyces sp. RK31]MCM2513983.1 hypothetical protein [Streptomyces griseoincarnatus]